MMMLLRKRRVVRGICAVLACYTVFLLALAWTAGDGDVADQPEFFSVLKLRQLGRDLQQKAKGVAGLRSGASPAQGLLGRALQHQPGKMPSRRQLSKPDVQQINVIVEDPLPGTFVKQAADPGSEGLQDLVSEDKKPPLRSSPIADPRALDRILAGSPVDDSRTTRTEKSKFLSKDSPRLRDQKVEKENDSGFKDFDPKEQEAEEKETNLGEWISPDGAVDNQRETETDVLGSSKDAQRTHSRAQDAEQFHTERSADPQIHANSEQQTGKAFQRNRPAHPQTQRSSEQQTGGALQRNRPAHPQTQRSSEQQTGGALEKNRPAHPQTQRSSEQQTGGALEKNRPAHPQTQRSSEQQTGGALDKNRPAHPQTQRSSEQQTGGDLERNRPAHPQTQKSSEQQTGGALQRNRPAHPQTQKSSEQQTGGALQRNRPAHPQTQRSSEQQTGGALEKNRPAHPQTQRSSEQQTGGALQRNRPAHPQTQRSSEQQTGGALQRNRPAHPQTQKSSKPQTQHTKKEGFVDLQKPTNIRHHQTALNKTHKPVPPPTTHKSPPPSPPKTLSPSSPGFSVSRRAANFVEISDLLVYSAFYDGRPRVPVVRILGVGPAIRRPPVAHLWCVFSTASAEPSPLSVRPTADCKRRRKYCFYMLLCQVPDRAQKNNGTLANLMLVAGDRKDQVLTSRSGERVRLQVIHNTPHPTRHVDDVTSASGSAAAAAVAAATTASGHRSPTFAVCVPPLFGKISVLQIVEFIEMNRLLGASHLVFYTFSVSREVSRVLAFYEEAGVASVMPWNIPAPNDVWNKGESVAMGDCLYRSMHVMDYVIFSDMNDYLVPKREASWQAFVTKTVHSEPEMMKAAVFEVVSVKMYPNSTLTQSSSRTSITKSEVSKFLTVRNTLRAEAPDSNWTKLVVKPERVLELDPEFPPLPISRTFVSHKVDSGIAAMFHYTSKVCAAAAVPGSPTGSVTPRCGELREDLSVWKLKDLLLARTKHVVKTLNQQVEV